ncbi:DDE-type integrase/transposase/recombinase, partial [Streptococcus dysgalactiae subsp. equisimilis]|nr:DDE-type integrase/transposase/recombinase [Streptococcus dysgalactiae subsp. equisimilis]
KFQAIIDYPEPETVRQLRCFAGLANFYRRFVPNCADLMQPLTDLLKGNKKSFTFTDSAKAAFAELKQVIANMASLSYHDPAAPLALVTDASDVAVGAVLQQNVDGNWQPLAFFSKRLQPAETRYSAFGKELLAVYLGIRHFRHALEGRPFAVFTDHKPLVYAARSASERYSPREVRHLDYVTQFTSDIRHVSGVHNPVADALSRITNLHSSPTVDLAQLAASQLADPDIERLRNRTALHIVPIALPSSSDTILCDVSQGQPRPLDPLAFRRAVFDSMHSISHPGIRATTKLVTARYVWPRVNSDVRQWARSCLQCQRSKVHRHTRPEIGAFPTPDARLHHVHVDLVGPLPVSHDAIYLLTCVDRFTRWPDAIPLPGCSSEIVARAFLQNWVARYGCPAIVTTDRGSHFDGSFGELLQTLGTRHVKTTVYHPAANGMVERFHRQLKASLRATEESRWTEVLPLVLLGIRATVKADLNASPAELVYGTSLRLPGELISPKQPGAFDYGKYVERLKNHMRSLRPTAPRTRTVVVQKHPELATCPFIFLRTEGSHPPLTAPYTGPHRVLRRADKTFVIDREGRKETVTIERVKPAFLDDPAPIPSTSHAPTDTDTHVRPPAPSSAPIASTASPSSPELPLPASPPPPVTNSRGRTVRKPVRFTDYVSLAPFYSSTRKLTSLSSRFHTILRHR